MIKPSEDISGFQIAFLVFAMVVLAHPLTKYSGPWSQDEAEAIARAFLFGTAIAVLCGIPRLRRACRELLSKPIAPAQRVEVVAVTAFHLLTPFALCGLLALEAWLQGGGDTLASKMNRIAARSATTAAAYSFFVFFMTLPAGWLVAPVVEELMFRGFMFTAWARQFGGFVATILTGIAFGIYHPFFTAAFTGSLLYTCLFRRTGTLRAPIVSHCIYNVLVWPPLVGQFIFRPAGDASSLSAWWPQLACLAATVILIPAYLWISRD
jgi:membrane protease YdiL (CAAX protease family)